MDQKREMIGLEDVNLSIARRCQLAQLARSTYYYNPLPESDYNLGLMKMIDQQYIKTPFYGYRRITKVLQMKGETVNGKRVRRLMNKMGIETMYPKPRTSISLKAHYKYPYLLGDIKIHRPNQVWGTDITYIPMESGYLYLAATMDLFSRYVLSWVLSDSLESEFCVESLEKALSICGRPEILNSDQGCQFTSKAYTDVLRKQNIAISMSGKGRCWDNIFVERLWRSLKYEEVYLKHYASGKEAQDGLDAYLDFYNNERLHANLNYNTPLAVYNKRCA